MEKHVSGLLIKKSCPHASLHLLLLVLLLAAASLVRPAMAQTTGCTPSTATDWMTNALTADPLAQDIRPRDCASVLQTPPDFRWPDVISSGSYQVTLTYPDGHVRTLTAAQNWINWDEILPAGTYTWSASYAGGAASTTRRFFVTSASLPFLVPPTSTMISTIVGKPHPRSLPDATTLATMSSQRSSAINQLLNDVSGHFNMSLPSDGSSADDAWTYSKYALSSLMACAYSNQDSYCNDAINRVTNLASWNPTGATAYTASGLDMAARYLTWTIALGYDWLYPRLSSTQRSQILSSISTRNGQMYNDIIDTRARIAQQPRDSHPNQTLSYVAVISALVAGDLSVASTTWLPGALPLAINATNPWGGEEGGFANATTQGNWDVGELLPLWYELRLASGVDMAQKPWVRNWGRYFTYFTPPGNPAGTTEFGDGFEENESEHQSRFMKGYTYFLPSPLSRWHASLLSAEDPTRFEFLMSPPADFSGSQSFPLGTPNGLALPYIGQVAMHSDLSNTGRTSVYFKSSPPPYGAFNHSHADQNSFVVNAGGQRLAIESGYYDDYKTQHWWNWYHTTQSKNAITYDGGQGQQFYDLNNMGYGRITNFITSPTFDTVSGDATQAYGGALSLAQRTLLYVRPNLILVYDNLASSTARQWEWNIHAVNQMTNTSDTQATIQNGGQSLCVSMLAGPPSHFTQTSQFTANPVNISWSPQWHGRFYSASKSAAAEYVFLLNVGCTSLTATATKSSGAWTVTLGSQTFTIGSNGFATQGTATLTAASGGTTFSTSTSSSTGTTSTSGSTSTTSTSGTTSGSTSPTSSATSTYPTSYTGTPYGGTPPTLPGTFPAVNFDQGGQGVAYNDTTPGNAGGQYRLSEDVDITASSDTMGNGYTVYTFATGEWLNYTVNVASAGNYFLKLRVANHYTTTPAFHVEVDGKPVTASIPVPNTGGWSTYSWVATPAVALPAGKHLIRLVCDQQYFNVDLINVAPASFSSTPFTGTPIPIPGNFEAENFDKGGQNVAYYDSTPGNSGGQYRLSEDVDIVASTDPAGGGYVVNGFTNGEWLNYSVNVQNTGNYVVSLRAASNYGTTGGAYHIELDGTPVTGTIPVPVTGSWSTFGNFATPPIPMTAGNHVLTIVCDRQYFNLNSVSVTASP